MGTRQAVGRALRRRLTPAEIAVGLAAVALLAAAIVLATCGEAGQWVPAGEVLEGYTAELGRAAALF